MYMPFQSASNSLEAPTSASSSLAGQIGAWLLAQPTLVAPAARSAIAARPCAEQQVVRDRQRVEHQRPARGVRADRVAEHRHDVRLVDRDPVLDPVGEPLADDGGVLGEPVDRVAVQPAAVVLERLRQVPVVERHHRLRRRPRAARRSAGRRTPGPSRWPARSRSAGSAARRSRTGSRRRRAASSARRPRRSGGSGRRRPRRVEPSMIRPGCAVKVSQMLGPLPSSVGRALDLVRRGAGPEPEAGRELGESRAARSDGHNDACERRDPPGNVHVLDPRRGTAHPALVLVRAALRPGERRASGRWSATTTTCSARAAASTTTRTATSRSSRGC